MYFHRIRAVSSSASRRVCARATRVYPDDAAVADNGNTLTGNMQRSLHYRSDSCIAHAALSSEWHHFSRGTELRLRKISGSHGEGISLLRRSSRFSMFQLFQTLTFQRWWAPPSPLLVSCPCWLEPGTRRVSWRTANLWGNGTNCCLPWVIFILTFQNHTNRSADGLRENEVFLVILFYLFLREFSLRDFQRFNVMWRGKIYVNQYDTEAQGGTSVIFLPTLTLSNRLIKSQTISLWEQTGKVKGINSVCFISKIEPTLSQ